MRLRRIVCTTIHRTPAAYLACPLGHGTAARPRGQLAYHGRAPSRWQSRVVEPDPRGRRGGRGA